MVFLIFLQNFLQRKVNANPANCHVCPDGILHADEQGLRVGLLDNGGAR
jgi:hypothetical protein